MTAKPIIVTPSAADMRDFPSTVQRWVQEVSRALNGGTEGADGVGSVVASVEGIATEIGNVNAQQRAILDGTVSLANVVITGRGRLTDELDALQSNQDANATATGGSGSLTATASPKSAYAEAPLGNTATTPTITVAAQGGTAPYAYAWTRKSGDVGVTATAPSSATTAFTATAPEPGDFKFAQFCVVVTDDAGATFEVCVNVTITSPSGGGGNQI